MPNWCSNSVTLTHEDQSVLVRAKEAFRQGKLLNEFVPCPGGWDYDWCVENWGTKWDVGSEAEAEHAALTDGELTLHFDSAWSPPIVAYENMLDQGFGITAYYFEPGMAFCGCWEDGVDSEYHIPSTSAEAAKVIPVAIDQAFDIVNSLAMWEDEDGDGE